MTRRSWIRSTATSSSASWEALETLGHVPERFEGAIGVFAGCGMNTYMLNNLLTNEQLVRQLGMFLLRHTANDKDFLDDDAVATSSTCAARRSTCRRHARRRWSPSTWPSRACSPSSATSRSPAESTIEVPHRVGYQYQEGEVLSPDGLLPLVRRALGGHRADERRRASWPCAGSPMRIADGDPILAVVKGTAINNDGQRKVGYLAPSVDGHADVVKEALAVAGLVRAGHRATRGPRHRHGRR